ncbi:MAG: ATP-dependent zinc metalloprotease FtsH 3 [Bacteroidetes bacterium ADurb.Bin234]|jgi:cell division protease FtsH|nr:MAG: ATP-dependent zinc metalloprotease FtsH 3 [Bacteroidetes bacterium ADurb.Bin234]
MDEKNPKDPQQPKDKKRGFNFYWLYGILTLAIIVIGMWGWQPSTESVDNVKLEKMIAQGDIEKIVIVKQKEQAQIYLRASAINSDSAYRKAFDRSKSGPHYFIDIADIATFSQEIKDAEEKAFQRDTVGKTPEEKIYLEKNLQRIVVLSDNSKKWGWEILSWILPFLLLIAFFYWSMRGIGKAGGGGGGQIFNIGKSKAQLYDKNTQPSVTFNDVAGLESAKEEVVEIVDFLKNPQKYTSLGGKIPKGALLVGPPGTGKTLLARAVAGEAKVPFFSLSGSDFVEMFVGVGASRVRDLFKTAKEKAPCIIFIDEIDAVGRARGRNAITGANDERENTLNQLLTEMDGFSTNAGIIMLAATNRADILDRALLRAGRFDRQIHVELPDVEERIEIFKVHIRPLKLSKNVDIEFFARQTPGFSGADIANVCNEAALIAARNNKTEIEKSDFLSAIDRIIGGLERRSKIISPKEKKVIAFHEAGHATVSWMLEHASPLVKVTIVPRGKSLGAAWYLPEERQITNTDQLMDEISATLGGRAAEDVVFGKISTGALNDLERVTKQAYAMVMYYGLNEKIGNLSYYDSSGQSEYTFAKPYSETTAKLIDEEVHKLIDKAYQQAKDILITHKEQLTILATKLLEKEVIYREDLVEVFGERPFEPDNKIIKNNNDSQDTIKEKDNHSVDF